MPCHARSPEQPAPAVTMQAPRASDKGQSGRRAAGSHMAYLGTRHCQTALFFGPGRQTAASPTVTIAPWPHPWHHKSARAKARNPHARWQLAGVFAGSETIQEPLTHITCAPSSPRNLAAESRSASISPPPPALRRLMSPNSRIKSLHAPRVRLATDTYLRENSLKTARAATLACNPSSRVVSRLAPSLAVLPSASAGLYQRLSSRPTPPAPICSSYPTRGPGRARQR